MAYDIEGEVKIIEDVQTFGSGFTKRAFVIIVEDGKYPQEIALECLKDTVSQLDGISVGDQVRIKFDIRGREYNGRYFNNLVAWSVKSNSSDKASNSPSEGNSAPKMGSESPVIGVDDDIPF